MAIHADSSIVPDSTMSSSPAAPESPAIRRAKHIYGRKPILDPDSSATLADSSIVSHTSSYTSASYDAGEETSPTSDAFDIPEPSSATRDDDDAEGTDFASANDMDMEKDGIFAADKSLSSPARSEGAGAANFQFGWKRRMAQIDEDFDDEDLPVDPPRPTVAQSASKILGDVVADTSEPPPTQIMQPIDDLFDGSPLTLTDSSQPLPASTFTTSPSPSPDVGNFKKAKRRAKRVDSDDEMADSSFNSPEKRSHSINTPKSRSSPTPPTSDMGMSKPQDKGKGRALARSVSPLVFSDKAPHLKTLSKQKGSESRPKVKAPTKKELKETHIDKHRIIADKKVEIKRADVGPRYNLTNLFHHVQEKNTQKPQQKPPSSDPIQPFSSSPADAAPPVESGQAFFSFGAPTLLEPTLKPQVSHRVSAPGVIARPSTSDLPILDDSDDELPELSAIFAADEKARLAKQLAERKRRILAEQKAHVSIHFDDDDDDDLLVESDMHAVVDEEAEKRRLLHASPVKPSEGRKRQLAMGRVVRSKADKSSKVALAQAHKDPLEQLKESAQPAFSVDVRNGKAAPVALTQAQLNRAMLKRAEEEKAAANRQKEEEWIRRGGKVIEPSTASSGGHGGLAAVIEKGIEAGELRTRMRVDDEEDEASDGSDEDFNPEMRGSASPEPVDEGSGNENAGDDAASEMENAAHRLTDEENEETEDKENSRPLKIRRSTVHRAVVDSDEDNDDMENTRPLQSNPSIGRILVPDTSFAEEHLAQLQPGMMCRRSLSPFDSPTEDENDKENNNQLMFDKSEDKENKAVVRHSLRPTHALGSRSGSLFGLEDGITRGLSMSPGIELSDGERGFIRRKPLEALRDDDDPFAFSPSASFTKKMQRASTSGTPLASPPPVFSGQSPLAFSQFFQDDGDEPPAQLKVGLQPGFSQSSLAPAILPLKASGSGGFSQWSEDEHDSGLEGLRKLAGDADGFSLTFDLGLQPALKVDENLRRQADVIFEKEQAYLVETANRKPQKSEELYVNDHGFLTQTRPDVSSPEIYRVPSPSQSQIPPVSFGSFRDSISHSAQRLPLRTISVDDIPDSPENAPLRRLRKRGSPSVARSSFNLDRSPSPSPTKRSRNLFDDMLKAQARKEKVEKKLEKSEFVAAEAEESDDDDQFGFGARKKDDGEEDDGDDQDKTLEGLVDDAVMDEETINEDLVLEKAKEHQAADDQAIEKLHMDAVEGKLRVKKRGGLGIDDDSEEDDDDEEDKRRRRQMAKRRRIEGDSLDALSKDIATVAFVAAYRGGIEDDNAEFEHLQSEDVVMASDDEDSERMEIVSTTIVQKQLRAAANQHADVISEPLDPYDVDWVDLDDDDGNGIVVKSVSRHVRVQRPQADIDIERPTAAHTESEHEWARREHKASRNVGTGRSAVGAAVTGHKAKTKMGGGSLRSMPSVSTSTAAALPRKPSRAPTMLSVLSDKSSRFG